MLCYNCNLRFGDIGGRKTAAKRTSFRLILLLPKYLSLKSVTQTSCGSEDTAETIHCNVYDMFGPVWVYSQPAYSVGPPSARQWNAVQTAFRWLADDVQPGCDCSAPWSALWACEIIRTSNRTVYMKGDTVIFEIAAEETRSCCFIFILMKNL